MVYVFYGDHPLKVADRTRKLVEGLKMKRPDASVFVFEEPAQATTELDELVEAKGLFVERHIMVIKTTFDASEHRDAVLERLSKFAASEHVIVISLGPVKRSDVELLKEHATEMEEHRDDAKQKPSFNVFSLGDALGARNRRELWLRYVEARRAGHDPASLHGTLMWAVRSMLLASRYESAESAGQKSNVYAKFRRYAHQYSYEELRELSRTLITLYHESRRGTHDLDTALERFILKG